MKEYGTGVVRGSSRCGLVLRIFLSRGMEVALVIGQIWELYLEPFRAKSNDQMPSANGFLHFLLRWNSCTDFRCSR